MTFNYRDTRSNLAAIDATSAGLDAQKGKTLEDMSSMVHTLTMKISERKTRLAPIIKELRPLRAQCQEREVSILSTYVANFFGRRGHKVCLSDTNF